MSSSTRYQLLGAGGTVRGGSGLGDTGTTGWATGDSDEEVQSMRDIPQIKQQQYQILEEQDRGLEALSQVITRQKRLARDIGDEVDYQNELIEDITTHVDRTRDRIQGETQRVRTIDRKDKTCGYWIAILSLLVVIIIIVSI